LNGKLILIGIVVLFVVLGGVTISTYNGLVSSQVGVDQAWGDIQVQYQRRYDLIPKLTDAVNKFVTFEQKLLTDIAAARSAWTQSLKNSVEDQAEASKQLDSVTSRLLAIVTLENYPDLKSNQLVLGLMDELAGTENRVAVSRLRYNDAVATYNSKILRFPDNILAGSLGFQKRAFFNAQSGAEFPSP